MDKQWNDYLNWRTEKGYKGISTEEQYNEFLESQPAPTDDMKMSKKEATELEEWFQDVTVKPKVQATFEVIKEVAIEGGEIEFTEVAELTGFSLSTVKRHVEELTEKGYIHVKRGQHTNQYFYGVDMRATNKPKKTIIFQDNFEWSNHPTDVLGEVTKQDATSTLYLTKFNTKEILDRTAEFLPIEPYLPECEYRSITFEE